MQDEIEKQTAEEELRYEPVFVARQPVYKADNSLWGYELLFRRSGSAAVAEVDSQEQATASVIADGFTIASESTAAKGRKFLINFPEPLLLNDSALALPKEYCIPEVLENVTPSPEIVKAVKKLKDAGYLIAIDDFVGQPGFEPLLEIADIIKVEVLALGMPELIALTEGLSNLKAKLLAEKVEDQQTFELTKALGYTYFQGFFFSRPEIMPGRKISATLMAKLNLLKELADENVTPNKLSESISTDATLTYRLMRFINSAAFSFMKHITSIPHAISLMGIGSLKKWLMLVFITDLNPSAKAQELTLKSVQRAKFLERLAGECKPRRKSPDAMFMLGLFSHLDALLGMPMEEVTKNLPLDKEIKDALNGAKNESTVWLHLLRYIDEGDWEKVERIIKHFGLNPETTARGYTGSGLLARKLMGYAKAS